MNVYSIEYCVGLQIRRRALEASRRERLNALQARWESRAQQLASRAELLEHSRRAAARAKEQHREEKMATLVEQQRSHIEQLRHKIKRKVSFFGLFSYLLPYFGIA